MNALEKLAGRKQIAERLQRLLMGGKEAPSVGAHARKGAGIGALVGGVAGPLRFRKGMRTKLTGVEGKLLGPRVVRDGIAASGLMSALGVELGLEAAKLHSRFGARTFGALGDRIVRHAAAQGGIVAGGGLGAGIGAGVGALKRAKYLRTAKKRGLLLGAGTGAAGLATAGGVAALSRKK